MNTLNDSLLSFQNPKSTWPKDSLSDFEDDEVSTDEFLAMEKAEDSALAASHLYSAVLSGIQALPVEIQVSILRGLPAFAIIGLPDTAVKESRERVRSAIENSGFNFPMRNLVVHLAPGHLKKVGTQIDLAIALGILIASNQISGIVGTKILALGELTLNGEIRSFKGIMPLLLSLTELPGSQKIIPREAKIPEFLPGQESILPVSSLADFKDWDFSAIASYNAISRADLAKAQSLYMVIPAPRPPEYDSHLFQEWTDQYGCFSQVIGQERAKRSLTIAAIGRHNILLMGPPGCGKSMLAQRFRLLSPPLDWPKRLETLRIHSVYEEKLFEPLLYGLPPFRAPHHSATEVSLLGGGMYPRAGEITFAHNGVLFLDEMAEFSTHTLQALREPMENHSIQIQRQAHSLRLPADFQLIAASNPCRCGYYFDSEHSCSCAPITVRSYISKINGPLIDRMDLEMEMPRPELLLFRQEKKPKTSYQIYQEIYAARIRGWERWQKSGLKEFLPNGRLLSKQNMDYFLIKPDIIRFLHEIIHLKGYSMRYAQKIIAIARSIADLEAHEWIGQSDIIEAVQYKKISEGYRELGF